MTTRKLESRSQIVEKRVAPPKCLMAGTVAVGESVTYD